MKNRRERTDSRRKRTGDTRSNTSTCALKHTKTGAHRRERNSCIKRIFDVIQGMRWKNTKGRSSECRGESLGRVRLRVSAWKMLPGSVKLSRWEKRSRRQKWREDLTLTSAFLFSKVLAAVMRKKTTSELEKSSPAELQQHVTRSANFGFLNQLNFYEKADEGSSATSANKAIHDN